MTFRYGQLVCRTSNIGDDFQSLAACQHLPETPTVMVDRDSIDRDPGGGPVLLVMNGWFSRNTEAWPPSSAIYPLFVGFHVTGRFKPTVARHAGYLKSFQPIGVRDNATAHFLQSLGIATETTYCLTLTFPRRERAPRDGKTFIVDAESIAIPKALRKGAVKLSHVIPPLGPEATLPFGQKLLEMYRDNASLVITTRLHAALPCLAMGIPVILFGIPGDGRTSIVRDIGGTIYDQRLHSKAAGRGVLGQVMNRVDWSPQPLELIAVKERLAKAVATRLKTAQDHFDSRGPATWVTHAIEALPH